MVCAASGLVRDKKRRLPLLRKPPADKVSELRDDLDLDQNILGKGLDRYAGTRGL